MNEIVFFIDRKETAYLQRLARLVNCNSGIDNPAGRLQILADLQLHYEALGFATERIDRGNGMVHLVARRAAHKANAPKVLILGHVDTVYDSTSAFQRFGEDGDWLTGPGVGDMKGGLVVAQAAMEALHHVGHLGDFDWLCVHNGDEEVTSPTSRDLIEQCAVGRDLCLDFEIGRKTGAVVRSRSGVGKFFITVRGKSAHSGMDHGQGVNAIVGLSHLIIALAALTDPAKGTTVNVGVVKGGTKRNVVPDEARCEVDVRVQTLDEGERVEAQVRELCSRPPIAGAAVECQGGIGRPPWQGNAACDRLIAHFGQVAAEHGFAFGSEDTGGGSDANFTAALGIASIDGLGPVGENPHTFQERIRRHSVAERAKLVALALVGYKGAVAEVN